MFISQHSTTGWWWRLFRWFRHMFRRRVPLVLQLSTVECGAACLAMMLGFFGRKTRIAECRELCMPGRDGLNAQVIAKAARAFGLDVRAFALQHTDFSQVQLPAIIHWNFNHFVILEWWSPTKVGIIDPALGRRTVSSSEFDRRFTGIVLVCKPGEQFSRQSPSAHSPWRSFARTLLDSPGLVWQIILASLLLQAVGFALPFMTKLLVDMATTAQFTNVVTRILFGLGLIALIKFVVQFTRSLLLIQFQLRFDTLLMQRFFRHLLSLPVPFFEQRTSGDLLMRLTSNSAVREIITGQALSVILDGLMMVVYLGVLFWSSPALGVAVVLLGLLQVGLVLLTNGQIQQLIEADILAQSESQSYLVEALGGINTVKALGAEDQTFLHWQNLFFKQRNSTLRRQRVSSLVEGLLATFQMLTPLILLWIGLQYVHSGQFGFGSMLALLSIASLALTPIHALISQGQRFQVLGAYLERLFDVLNAQPEQPEALTETLLAPELQGAISLENISFRYDQHTPYVLENISLTIQPGQKVALVGRTGSGKTTLARLMLGLYTPEQGQIRYDQRLLQEFDLPKLRAQIGVVMQDSFLFSGSIRQNIDFYRPEITYQDVLDAAQQAGIHPDIQRMPMGYETRITEGGNGISGGQRQRISLARALAGKPHILILDEATSHLDTTTERVVEENLGALQCTRIVIAHRLSTIRDADLIVVIDQGQIVEQGTHHDLLAREGAYATLLRNQLGS